MSEQSSGQKTNTSAEKGRRKAKSIAEARVAKNLP